MSKVEQLGKYQIEELLGSGAYAEVYRATDTTLKRTVALKVLKPMLLADEEAFGRFLQEAQTAADLFHPHIATVLDLGESDGRYFIAMRYVDGESLDKVIKERGPLPWREALKITEEIAEALHFAHNKGLVHRDIKPQNILISAEDGAMLTDFGLVKAMTSSGMTTTGSFLGTPHYMAPEIWKGDEVTPATDQYALACVLAEMLTGRILYAGKTPPSVMAKHFQPPVLPETWPEETPENITALLEQALTQTPAERYENIVDFVKSLHAPEERLNAKRSNIQRSNVQHSSVSTEDEMVITLAPGVEMAFMRIPAGTFLMGSINKDEEAYDDEKPQHQVHLDEYWMGKYPVTNTQYKAFVDATGQDKPYHFRNGEIPKGKHDHPVVEVSWHDARVFCKWASEVSGEDVRLPTEAEWEKAARGDDGRIYPWGHQKPDPGYCNYDKNIGDTTRVGRYSPKGDSPYGCADIAGNVWEWTSSLKKDYPYRAGDGREKLDANDVRVLRGGSWSYYGYLVRAASRNWNTPDLTVYNVGFRCVRSAASP